MSDNNDFGTFFAGFVIGGLVGAAVAMLLAPQSGEDTRTLIHDRSIELRDKAVEVGQDARGRAEKALEDARVRADAAIVDLRERSEDLARLTKERTAELQQRGQAIFEEQKARLTKKTVELPATDETAAEA
jgi:gas vesicle protein